MKILVTGACGYKGTVLVPKLLARGHQVTAFDLMWFGNFLQPHPDLTVINGDVRNIEQLNLDGIDAIIHLSSVANDPCGDLDPKLTWEISALATMQLADKAVRKGVKRFIYASSGSVYGVKDEPQVTEDLELKPISEYNKTKMVGERVLLSYRDDMVAQTRPNIHIDDITDAYVFLLENPQHQGVFNAGFENISILDIARMVSEYVPSEIVVSESNDPRSYRVNSDRLLATGFRPRKAVRDAIKEIIEAHKSGLLKDEDRFYNLKWMQRQLAK